MKDFVSYFVGILIILTIDLGCNSDQAQKVERLERELGALGALAAPPPSSLDRLFPPRAEQPIFHVRMLEMSTSLSGIAADLFENDFEQLRKINRRVHFGLDPVSDHKEIKCAIIAPE